MIPIPASLTCGIKNTCTCDPWVSIYNIHFIPVADFIHNTNFFDIPSLNPLVMMKTKSLRTLTTMKGMTKISKSQKLNHISFTHPINHYNTLYTYQLKQLYWTQNLVMPWTVTLHFLLWVHYLVRRWFKIKEEVQDAINRFHIVSHYIYTTQFSNLCGAICQCWLCQEVQSNFVHQGLILRNYEVGRCAQQCFSHDLTRPQ